MAAVLADTMLPTMPPRPEGPEAKETKESDGADSPPAEDVGTGTERPFSRPEKKPRGTSSSDRTLSESVPGTLIGTPRYMPPEQSMGGTSDERSDQYSLGCILYELLTGSAPFRSQALPLLLKQHRREPVPPLRQREPAVSASAELEALIVRMLAKQPGDRLSSMGEVVRALEAEIERLQGVAREKKSGMVAPIRIEPATPAAAKEAPAPVAPQPPRRRWPWIALALMGGAALVSAVLVGWHRPPQQKARSAEQKLDLLAARAESLAVLKELLHSSQAELRRDALQGIGTAQEESLQAEVAKALHDPDEEVRAQAALVLAQLGVQDQRAALRALALAPVAAPGRGQTVRTAALAALMRLGDADGEAGLRRDLASADPELRQRSAFALGARRDPSAMALLAAAAAARPEPDEGSLVLWSRLLQAGEPSAKGHLLAMLSSEASLALKLGAAAQLAERGDEQGRTFLRTISERPGPEQLTAARLLASPEEPGLRPRFRALLGDPQASAAARLLAVEGIGRCGEIDDVRLLLPLLRAQPASGHPTPPIDERLRLAAAGSVLALLLTDPRGASERSLRRAQLTVNSESWLARRAAADLLGAAPAAEAVPLLGTLLKDRVVEVRRSAARALAGQGTELALRTLRAGLSDPEPEVRKESLRSIARAGELMVSRGMSWVLTEVQDWSRDLISSNNPVEQVMARTLLLRLGDTRQIEPLTALLRSPIEEVRRTLVTESGPNQELLRLALADGSAAIRLLAAERLAWLGSRDGIPILRQVLEQGSQGGHDANAMLRAHALLTRLGETASLPSATLLAEALRRGDRAALHAVTLLPAVQALSLLREAASSSDPATRQLAVAALAQAPELAMSPGGLAMIRRLLYDDDVQVRQQAMGVLSRSTPGTQQPANEPVRPREFPPDRATEAAGPVSAPSVKTDDVQPEADPGLQPALGTLLLRTPAAGGSLPVRIDAQPWQLATARAVQLPAGRHVITTLAGARSVEIQAGRSVPIDLALAPVEQTAQAGHQAFERGDLTEAQRHLEKANALCARDRTRAQPCALLMAGGLLRLGSIYEGEQRYLDAMSLYESALKSAGAGSTSPPAATRRELTTAAARIAPQLGRVLLPVRSGSRCEEVLRWMRPGSHTLVVQGTSKSVQVQAGAITRAGSCADR